ncbi:serine/threonine-protein kinase H1 homolog isoform X1 [Heterodontus francisci]|uniref:serine/threonine-protein kinase H1 homolog isoform X1 n=1 Tax=Heterodontus francisci TaxID=7792 RepID=UPI00355AF6C5
MGCGISKVLPEPPKDFHLDLVKTVEPYTGQHGDKYKHFIKYDAIKSVGKTGQPPPHQTNVYQQSGHWDQQSDPRKNKVAKYRAKFDPRVTAKYDIKALIGRGSFSRVVRVEHKSTKQPYAIKLIETKYKEGREVCESELNVLRRVRHTNVIQLIEVFETQERVYMVMELATGGELFDRIIAKGSFTERDATRVLQMVLDGVKYLHILGITHRDLKPENLLYYHPGADSKIMITDFGLASTRKKGDDCLMKTTCGTPEYIAPEILVRKPYTNSVDMWALGVVSYILLSGTMPFEDDNRTRLYRQILKGKYSYSGEVNLNFQSTGRTYYFKYLNVQLGPLHFFNMAPRHNNKYTAQFKLKVLACVEKPWPSVSNLAKDFIDRLLTVDPNERLTVGQALKHPWIVSMAASSSMKNLHRSISQNLLKRASSRCQSTKSAQSTRSSRSTKSNKSRRVRERELRELNLRYQQQYEG